jgi:hypothetical protein
MLRVTYDSELRCQDVRVRAAQRAGQLLHEMEQAEKIAKRGAPKGNTNAGKQTSSSTRIDSAKPAQTLAALGITYDQSSQWKELAGIEPEETGIEFVLECGAPNLTVSAPSAPGFVGNGF